MPRIPKQYQAVYKGIVDSVRVNSVSEAAECLYYRLLIVSDDYGRYHGDPFDITARALTARWKAGRVTPEDVAARIVELERVGLVRRYEAEGELVLELMGYQDPTSEDRRRGVFPPCPQDGDEAPQAGDGSPLARARAIEVEVEVEVGVGGRARAKPTRVTGLDAALQESGAWSPEAVALARGYSEHRRAVKAKDLKPATWERHLADAESDPAAYRAALEASERNGWTGIFPDKYRGKNGRVLTKRQERQLQDEAELADYAERIVREHEESQKTIDVTPDRRRIQ